MSIENIKIKCSHKELMDYIDHGMVILGDDGEYWFNESIQKLINDNLESFLEYEDEQHNV